MADDTLDAALEEESSAPEAADAVDQIATMADFGRALSALLDSHDLTIRKAARRAEIANSTLHNWSKGDHLPTGDEQVAALTRVLHVCGVDSPAEVERWRQALGRVRRQPGRKPAGDAPYRGLASFAETDARWSFGREEVADRLAAAMSDDADFHDLPLILVGPSGAGKSSVLRAGLLPRLTRPAVIFEPTSSPLAQLKAALSELRDNSPVNAERPAIIVDQFESLYTQAQDDGQRRAFIKELCDLADTRTAHVAVALRADFYDHAIRYAELAPALQYRQVVLGPMTAGEVSRAITEPARLARLDVEDSLVRLLLDDLAQPSGGAAPRIPRGGVQDGGAYEPGALPLLSHAMLATWENSRGNTLTVADYLASGRIRDAVQATAEAAYERLAEAEQALARRLFLRLVHVADDAPPTRAVVPLTELRDWADDGGGAEAVLSVFVGERMITVDAEAAQITHDALITAWPRLRGWIDEGQAGLITRRRITEAARAWEDASRDDTWLWRGGQLAIATEWAADNKTALTKLASEFVAASTKAERTRQLADRRRTRGLQALVVALTAFVVAIALIAVYAFRERHDAVLADNNAVSRQLAVEAGQLRGTDPAIAAQLSVAAYQVARTPQATAALLEASGAPIGARTVDSDGIVQWVAINPARTLMAAAGADGTLKLWNVTSPGRPVLVDTLVQPDSNHPLYVARFSPDGTVLAAAGAGEVVKLWDMSDPAHPAPLPSLAGPTSTIYSVAFSPDGRVVAAGSADDNAWLWHGSVPDHPSATGHPLTGAAGAVNSVAFGLGGTILAAGSADDKVRLYDVAAPGTPSLAATLSGPGDIVTGVAFSGTGELAATSHDAKVWLWKVTPAKSGAKPGAKVTGTANPGKGKAAKSVGAPVTAVADGTLSGAANWTNAVSFGPDGSKVAAGTSDGSVLVWNVASHALAARIPAPQPVTSVAWDGANRIAASDADGTATIWTLPAPTLLAGNKSAMVVYRPDGKAIAVGGTSVQLWNARSRALIATRRQANGATVNALSFSPDGTLLAAAYSDGTAQILDGGTLAPVSPAFIASAKGFAETVAFSPDGKTLAAGGDDGSVRLWSVADPARPAHLARVKDTGNQVYTVAFAPNGATLAAASTDDYTTLWNVVNPAAPQRYAARLGGLNSYAIGLAFTPDSKLLAVGSADQTVHLWNVAAPGHAVPVGTPLTGPSGYAWAAAVSPDSTTLAVGATDGSVWLWNISDPARPALIATLTGPADHVYSVAFNLAGTQLTATSYDGTVFTWDTSPAAARSLACASIGQPLTAAEWAKYAPGVPYRTPCA